MKFCGHLVLLVTACAMSACGPAQSDGPNAPQPEGTDGLVDSTPPKFRLPEHVRPLEYALGLSIVPELPTFKGQMAIDLQLTRRTRAMWLNARELTIETASLVVGDQTFGVKVLDGGDEFVGFAFDTPQGPGKARLHITYSGKLSGDKTAGLYRVQEDTGWYVYSMFEPLDARRAFPCFDEPAYKVPWKLTIRAPKDHVALANAPVVSESIDHKSGLRVVEFQESKPLPSYLVALVVGPFDVVDGGTAGQRGVRVRYVLPRGRTDELWYAKEVTPKAVGLLEDYFGTPYPYEKLDVAVVPRFEGTMEHPGLIAMGQPLALIARDADTVRRRQAYVNTLIHELAHYWFGNLVTHAWWSDLWLNESLAYWLDLQLTHRFEPAWAYPVERLWAREDALVRDSLLSARPIRAAVTSNDEVVHAFDGAITYSKGAQLMAMFETWLGGDNFQTAIRHYLKLHAWKNATGEDFLLAMSEKLGEEFDGGLSTFLEQPGFPLVTVRLSCEGERPALELSQTRFLNAGAPLPPDEPLWSFPVCTRYGAGKETASQCTLMTEKAHTVDLTGACPDWLIANADGVAYYRVNYGGDMFGTLLGKASGKLTAAERVATLGDWMALVSAGEGSLAEILAVVPRLVRGGDRHLVEQTFDVLDWVERAIFVELRPSYARWVRRTYGSLARRTGWAPRAKDTLDTARLRPTLMRVVATDGEDKRLRSQAKKLAKRYLADRRAVSPEMVAAVLDAAALGGDPSLFERYLAAAREAKDRRARIEWLSSLGWFPDPELAKQALALVAAGEFDYRDTQVIIHSALASTDNRELAWSFVKQHFKVLLKHMNDLEAAALFRIPARFCDPDLLADAQQFLGERTSAVPGAAPILQNAVERAQTCIAVRDAQQPALRAFFKR